MSDFVDATVPVLRDRTLSLAERIRRTVRRHIEISDDRRPELLIGNPIRYALDPVQREHATGLQIGYHDAVRDAIAEGCQAGEFRVADVSLTTMAILDMLNGDPRVVLPGGPSRPGRGDRPLHRPGVHDARGGSSCRPR